MNRNTQDKIINIISTILTIIVIIAIGYFSISSYQKIQQSAGKDSAKISDKNNVAKSERIDTKAVENELNRIAEEKRREEQRIAAEKAAREKAERERIEAERRAKEKAAQEKRASKNVLLPKKQPPKKEKLSALLRKKHVLKNRQLKSSPSKN